MSTKVYVPAQVETLNASSSHFPPLKLPSFFCFCISAGQKTQRNCLLPPCSSSFALCPLGSQGTIIPFFQAIAKPNLPHKLIGQHLKREGGGGEGENKREQKRIEGQRQNNNKATDQMVEGGYTVLEDHF